MLRGMRAVLIVLALVITGMASGCGNRAALCLETEIAYNDAIQRCVPGEDYVVFALEARPGVSGCSYVNSTTNESEITHQCLPWLAEVSCAEFLSVPGGLPDFCNPRDHFTYYHFEPLPDP